MAIVIIDDWACVAQGHLLVGLDIQGGWSDPLDEASVLLEPSEIIIAGWKNVDEALISLEPSEVIIAGWKRVSQTTVDLQLPVLCATDADCPEGYICVNGVCVPKEGFPWTWLAIGGTAAAAAVLIISAKQKEKKK